MQVIKHKATLSYSWFNNINLVNIKCREYGYGNKTKQIEKKNKYNFKL